MIRKGRATENDGLPHEAALKTAESDNDGSGGGRAKALPSTIGTLIVTNVEKNLEGPPVSGPSTTGS